MLNLKTRFSRVRSFGSVDLHSQPVVRSFGVLGNKPAQEETIVHTVTRVRPVITMNQSIGSTPNDL